MSRRILTILIIAVVAALGAAACTSDSGDEGPAAGVDDIEGGNAPEDGESDAASQAEGVETDAITIKDFEFEPQKIIVDAGAEVTVTNDDSATHTVTADDGAFDTGEIEPGGSASFTVSGDSVIPYHCEIHEFMTGEIVVKADGASGGASPSG